MIQNIYISVTSTSNWIPIMVLHSWIWALWSSMTLWQKCLKIGINATIHLEILILLLEGNSMHTLLKRYEQNLYLILGHSFAMLKPIVQNSTIATVRRKFSTVMNLLHVFMLMTPRLAFGLSHSWLFLPFLALDWLSLCMDVLRMMSKWESE